MWQYGWQKISKFERSKIVNLYTHLQIQRFDSLFNQNCLAIIRYSMNIPPVVILCYTIKLNHSCKYVIPKIQMQPGWRHLFSDKKSRKLTKIDIKLSMESVRIHRKEDIWGQIFFSLVNTCTLYFFGCICMHFNFVCKEQDWFLLCLFLEEFKPGGM